MLREIYSNNARPREVKSTNWDNRLQIYKHEVYDVDFNKTYYAPYKGALRAVKFVSLIRAHGSDTAYMCLKANMAGVGEIFMSPNTIYNDDVQRYTGSVYESVEDYEDRQSVGTIYIETENLFVHMFGKAFDYVCENKSEKFHMHAFYPYKFNCYRYKWDGTRVIYAGKEIVGSFNTYIELFPDGTFLIGSKKLGLKDFMAIINQSYPTIESCKEANKVSVVGFDDEKPKKGEKMLIVTVQLPKSKLPELKSLGFEIF